MNKLLLIIILIWLTSACSPSTTTLDPNAVITAIAQTAAVNPTETSTPSLTETPIPELSDTPTPTPTETPTPEPTGTPTPELLDWNYVSGHTDEEIFQRIGVPNPEDYGLTTELSPHKILRNEGGQSIALYQNPEGIVFLAQNLETNVTEHAVYAEYEGGVPLLILTDQSVVEHDNGWYQLNSEYGLVEARDRLAHAFNRALAMRWWGVNHASDGNLPFGIKDWLSEIPGYSPMQFLDLTRYQRTEISNYIMQRFIQELQEVRNNNLPFSIELPDLYRTEFNAANETLIIKTIIDPNTNWQMIYEHFTDSSHREVISEKNGTFLTLLFGRPSFYPYRGPRGFGGTMTHFFRYFFGTNYFYINNETDIHRGEFDMTGPILEDLCRIESLPRDVLNFYTNIYASMDNFMHPENPTNACALVFNR